MPITIHGRVPHSFFDSRLDNGGARHAHIVIVNLMADKLATELQLGHWLNKTPHPVRVTLATTNDYMKKVLAGEHVSKNTDLEHFLNFYKAWDNVKGQKIDGLLITGFNALKQRVDEEDCYKEICAISDHAKQLSIPSLHLCWAGKAILKHDFGIESIKGDEKTYGVYKHWISADPTGVMAGIAPEFDMPVSRWKNPDMAAVRDCRDLNIVGLSEETGANVIVDKDGRVILLGHPEYGAHTLPGEFERDTKRFYDAVAAASPGEELPKQPRPPRHCDILNPVNTWQNTGVIYANWLNAVCEATAGQRVELLGARRDNEQIRPSAKGSILAFAY